MKIKLNKENTVVFSKLLVQELCFFVVYVFIKSIQIKLNFVNSQFEIILLSPILLSQS